MQQSFLRAAAICIAAVVFSACGESAPQGGPPPPGEVGVIRVTARAVPLTRDLVGRLSPVRASDVRARVAGVLQKRHYEEGSDVKEGQLLFVIDPAPLRAAADAAAAALSQAEASAKNASVLAERLRSVVKEGYVSRSDLDTAEANERSTAAAVQQARADLDAAKINLSYAYVRSPISGRAGQQRVTEGALVGESEATLLTTVEQLDPMWVAFDQPASEILELRRAQAAGQITLAAEGGAQIQLVTPDGTPYGEPGTLDFSGVIVDPSTGALALRGTIPNPDYNLLPGMFVTVRTNIGELNRAFLVPQGAVQRDGQGPYVLVVGAENKVVQKRITTAGTSGTNWIVTQGLDDGDPVIVSGTQRAGIGAVVKPVDQAQLRQRQQLQQQQPGGEQPSQEAPES